jgi:hypothetical protein
MPCEKLGLKNMLAKLFPHILKNISKFNVNFNFASLSLLPSALHPFFDSKGF